MSLTNTGTSSQNERRHDLSEQGYQKLENDKWQKEQELQLAREKAQMAWANMQAQQSNNRLGALAQLIAKNSASSMANNVNWVGHTAEPAMPQFQPRFQGMFSGMLSDPWHQFMYQKEYENRRDRAIANQMDELYRRNQMDRINAEKSNQIDGLIATLMTNQGNLESIPAYSGVSAPTARENDSSFTEDSNPTPTNFREASKSFIKSLYEESLKSGEPFNYEAATNKFRDWMSGAGKKLVDLEYANRAEDLKNLWADPFKQLFGVSRESLNITDDDGVDLKPGNKLANIIQNNLSYISDGFDKNRSDELSGYFLSHYNELGNTANFNAADYTDVQGNKYSNARINQIGKRYLGIRGNADWTKDKMATALAIYDLLKNSISTFNNTPFTWDKSQGDIDTWLDNGASDEDLTSWWASNGIGEADKFLKKYARYYTLDSDDAEAWNLAEERLKQTREGLAMMRALKGAGVIDSSTYNTAKTAFTKAYNSSIYGRKNALDLIKQGNVGNRNLTELIGPFAKEHPFNPAKIKSHYEQVMSDVRAGLTRDEHIMADPRVQELFTSNKVEDKKAAIRFLENTYLYTGKYAALSSGDINAKHRLAEVLYRDIKPMIQNEQQQAAVMSQNVGSKIKDKIDSNFSENSASLLPNVPDVNQRNKISRSLSNLLLKVEGLPSHAYRDGGANSNRIAILYGVNMEDALKKAGVSPKEANKIATEAVNKKTAFEDLDPKYQTAILNYQSELFRDKWNMGLSSFGVANAQGKRPSSLLGISKAKDARYFDLMIAQANWRGDGPGMRKFLRNTTFQEDIKNRLAKYKDAGMPYTLAFLDLYREYGGSNEVLKGRVKNLHRFLASDNKA
jgi:hypothetical protein